MIQLKAGEGFWYDRAGGIFGKKGETEPVHVMGWIHQKLRFEAEPIRQVLWRTSQYFRVTLLTDGTAFNACEFSGNYVKPDLQQVLQDIETKVNGTFTEMEPGKWLLRGEGCPISNEDSEMGDSK